ncbi:hypothetical protein [Chelativorans sp. J32]|uniref:hypothetical protein n=1 Tax=Chelativorans sp. J32 TaxID=935840 RepID=UPI0004BB8686|nr:hypothetical protein [Chelativorans sp. J32]
MKFAASTTAGTSVAITSPCPSAPWTPTGRWLQPRARKVADGRGSYGYMTVMHELAANGKALEADLVDLRENALVGNRVLQ